MSKCKIETCEKEAKTCGFCPMHYRRMKLNGDPMIVKVQRFPGLSVVERFWKYVKKTDSCWLWIGNKHKQGYGQMMISGKTKLAHRLSWEIHYGGIIEGKKVLHKCDNPRCVNPDHLFLGTQQDNMTDMWSKGRENPGEIRRVGEKNVQAKITEEAVREIRSSLWPTGYLAKKFGITPSNVWCIRTRKSWTHIP